MKKILLTFLLVISIVVLSACESTLSLNSNTLDSISNNEISNEIIGDTKVVSIDYRALGFEKSFDEPVNLYTFLERTDGLINPFAGNDIEILIPDYKDELPFASDPLKSSENPFTSDPLKSSENPFDYFDPFYLYFDPKIYTHYRRGAISKEGFYYADTQLVDGKYRLRFFADGVEPYIYLNSRPYPFIDGIESNGVYSYVINKTYMDRAGNREIREYLLNLFYVIYHDETLPYTVYFSDLYIFLISKEVSFDKSCIDIFIQTEGVYLFKE
jgi:hypothetical protein